MEYTLSLLEELADKLQQIIESIDVIEERISFYNDVDAMLTSPLGVTILDACILRLQVIGESVRSIDNRTKGELLSSYPSIPWHSIIGMRNFISHEYANIDYDVVWNVITKDLKPLREMVCKIKSDLEE